MRCIDPVKFGALCWPDMVLYDKQREILYSLRDNDETVVVAGNGLGKDFITAKGAIWFFTSRRPARVVTTSVQGGQLEDVLWGEMRRFIETSKYPLPFRYNHLHIRHLRPDGTLDARSLLTGKVVNKGESLLGYHLEAEGDIPRTLLIFDEASGIDDSVYNTGATWAHRILMIGNPFPCENFFRRFVKEGDIPRKSGVGFHRKVIRIRAEDSPNVQLGFDEKRAGKEPSNRILIPGLLSYAEYVKRRALWSPMRQSISLDGEFYEGAEVLLHPLDWLNAAERRADALGHPRKAQGRVTMGIDAAEGGDSTVFVVCDEAGILELESLKTRDTSVIMGLTIAKAQRWNVKPQDIYFDAGGGGKQHADYLRSRGWNVKTVAFGGAVTPQIKTARFNSLTQRVDQSEERYVYKNRRAEMYGLLRRALDPGEGGDFALPACYGELRRQLELMPLRYDPEGRLHLPSKNKRSATSTEQCLVDIIGHSPDEADALVLANFGQWQKSHRVQLVSA